MDFNLVDRMVAWMNPIAGVYRMQARRALAHYDATKPGRLRADRNKNPAPNLLADRSARGLRNHARYLERNHDITRGVLRTLVNNVVGPGGIGIEPQPRRKDGSVHTEYAAQLREYHRRWKRRPEVTARLHWAAAERMLCYTWLRDGEAFAQKLSGFVPGLIHGSEVPFSLELMEPDFVPFHDDPARKIRQGIQHGDWGQALAYACHRSDPRDMGVLTAPSDLLLIPAANMLHISTMDRLHQNRGISEFASVLTRVEDLKDYEESERIAAKVAASMSAYVKRLPGPEGFESAADVREKDDKGRPIARELHMQPGMIFDDLQVGEEVGMIDTNRPNPNLVAWRSGQLRAYAAGVGASYSSISRDYNGTYSALRQELVEQWVHYAVLADDFAGQVSRPVWEHFVEICHLSGVVRKPVDLMPGTETDCLLIGQSMPWIDPLKEAKAWDQQVRSGFASEVEVIRRRGANPREVQEQQNEFRQRANSLGLRMSSNPAHDNPAPAAPSAPTEPEDPEDGDDTPSKRH